MATETAELVRQVLAEHVQTGPGILASSPPLPDYFMQYARQSGRGFHVSCSCGHVTDSGPRPAVDNAPDAGVTTDGSRLRALVLGRQHLAEEIARALEVA